ncbi:MAG: TolC family protein [Chitinophagales bacterium]|nr:TolC family protein [Chitinophagales bacterium]
MRRLLYKTTLALSLLPLAMYGQTEVSQEPVTLSLEDAMKYAVKHNASTKNARLDLKIQKAKNAEITGIALPQVSAKGEFNDYLNPIQSFVPAEFIGGPSGTFVAVPFTPKFSATASASASQVLFDGSVMVALQARNAILKLYEHSVSMSEEELRYNVQKAYYAFVIAKQQFKILTNSMRIVRSSANDVKAIYQEGLTEKLEVDKITVQLNNLISDSIRIDGMMTVVEQLLKYQMGMDMEQQILLTDTTVDINMNTVSDMLSSADFDYQDRTEFKLMESKLNLNKYDLKRHKFSGLPSLAAFGTAAYTYSTNTFSDVFKEQYIFYSLVGLQLRVPIFDGLQRHNRVVQAKYAVKKSENDLENLKLAIDFNLASSKTTLKNAIIASETKKRNLDLANSVLDVAYNKYKAGVGSNSEVTLAQAEMLKAQNDYFQSMLDVVNAKSDIQKALGKFK